MFTRIAVAYLLCMPAAMAQASDRQTREIAHCGYLTFIAADHGHQRGNDPSGVDAMIDDLVDFGSIFVSLTTSENLHEPAQITPEVVIRMTEMGQSIHLARIKSMSAKNSMRLSNRLLSDCRADLHLLELKLRAR